MNNIIKYSIFESSNFFHHIGHVSPKKEDYVNFTNFEIMEIGKVFDSSETEKFRHTYLKTNYRYLSSSSRIKVEIDKLVDDWFLVMVGSTDYIITHRMSHILDTGTLATINYIKCDQIDGLLHFLNKLLGFVLKK